MKIILKVKESGMKFGDDISMAEAGLGFRSGRKIQVWWVFFIIKLSTGVKFEKSKKKGG